MVLGHLQVISLFTLLYVVGAVLEPPDTVALIYPGISNIPVNDTIQIGVADITKSRIEGFLSNTTILVTFPNGTTSSVLGIYGAGTYPGTSYRGYVSLNQTGQYTVTWNITYCYPQNSNSTISGCREGIGLPTQSWSLKHSFNGYFAGAIQNATITLFTSTASLPSKPTGTATGSASSHRSKFTLTALLLTPWIIIIFHQLVISLSQ